MTKLRDLATKSRNLDFYSVMGGGHNDTFGTILFFFVIFLDVFLSFFALSVSFYSVCLHALVFLFFHLLLTVTTVIPGLLLFLTFYCTSVFDVHIC